ncbi:MAG: acetate kinase [Lachnospiraceae bacterium]|nr:acetate kinase [Lachnospiraceae bacterium]
MNILVINCGSSSLKYQLIDIDNESVLAKGIAERIGLEDGLFTYKNDRGDGFKKREDVFPTHREAAQRVLDTLQDPEIGVIKSLDEIAAVGHRIVHGGESFAEPVILTEEVLKEVEKCSDLAPLHNPANVIGIRTCQELMPETPQVGVFDTAFHQTMPPEAYMYAIPWEFYDKYRVRRYGFHGTSHKFVSRRLAELCDIPLETSKLIICHLGGGASVTAVYNGKSIDTSMGLTPLEGLAMGTRSGDIDMGAVEFIAKKKGMNFEQVMNMLNKESGVLGLSGVSSDFRDLWDTRALGNDRSGIALDMFCYRVLKYVGAYIAVMNGLDGLAFTAGIGENDEGVREEVIRNLSYMGMFLDGDANQARYGKEVRITTPESKVQAWVVPTDEELEIARQTSEVVG